MADIAQTEQSTHLHAPDSLSSLAPSDASQPVRDSTQLESHESSDAYAPAATVAQPTDSAVTNNVTSATTTTATTAGIPAATPFVSPAPVKKFAPMNATRKFLEKTSSSSTVPTSASSPATPGNKPPVRSTATPSPTTVPPATSSKLVSAKLSTTGSTIQGTPSSWARPPPAAAAPSPSPAESPVPVRAQPQPADGAQRKRSASPSKPVWGTPNGPSAPGGIRQASSDFPTAAEAARGWRRNLGTQVLPPPTEPSREQIRSDAQKQAMAESAALFRGAGLDPNVSHWDEMEDEEDFFQNPIEFGDGTQYKVDMPTDGQQHASSLENMHLNGVSKDDDEGGWTQVSSKGVLPSRGATTSAKAPSPVVSPHETHPPRALYNDRSNRFEPYNGKPSRGGSGPYRRDSRLSDDGRDAPPHRSPNVQLLKHASGEQQPVKSTTRAIPSVFDRPTPHERGREPQPQGRRVGGDMGPPPPPSRKGTNDNAPSSTREAPPHFGRVTPAPNGRDSPVSVTSSRVSVRERAPSVASSVAPMSIGKVVPEPAPTTSPISTQPLAPVLSPDEQEELMKKYQHELAEKARRRRLEEEAEREREKERARKKAAEIEERIAQEKLEKEAVAKAEAERKEKAEAERREKVEAERKEKAEAAKKERERIDAEHAALAASEQASRFDSIGSARGTASFGRPRAPSDRNTGFQPAPPVRTLTVVNPPTVDPVMKLDSWRTNAAPPPPRPSRHKPEGLDSSAKVLTGVSKPPPNFVTSLFTNDFSLKDEEIEVLDFSEISKLAPPEAAQLPTDAPVTPLAARQPIQLLQRQTATKLVTTSAHPDRPTVQLKSDANAWRKTPSESVLPATSSDTVLPGGSVSAQPQAQTTAPPPSVWVRRGPPQALQDSTVVERSSDHPPTSSLTKSTELTVPTSPTSSLRKHGRTSSTEQVSPRQVPYKEAPLSALTDTMSRIKGALAGMQDAKGKEKDTSSPSNSPESVTFKPVSFSPGWRERESKTIAMSSRELDSVTMNALVMAPGPDEATLPVRLPPVSRPRETATKRQIHLWSLLTTVRFEVLSFDPPVKGMSRRSFVVEEALFERAKVKQGATQYRVALPSNRIVHPRATSTVEESVVGTSALVSRPTLAASQGKPPATFGRTSGSSLFGARSRGVDDASWRKPVVARSEPVQTELNPVSRSPPPEPEIQGTVPTTPNSVHRLGQTSEAPKTPPILSAHWGQTAMTLPIINTPSRQAPDPEHLKQVWSQNPDQDGKPSSNSLQGIADEPTRLSFSMQEMKSEDGETPPPTMATSHSPTPIPRMSVADAHRAFQQVPTPSSSSSSPKPLQRPPPPQTSSHLSPSPSRPPPPPPVPRMFFQQLPPGAPHLQGPHGPHLYPVPPPPQQPEQRPPINGTTPHPQMAQGWVVGPAGAQPSPQQLLRPPHPGSPFPVQYVAYAPPGAMYGPHPVQSHVMPKPGPAPSLGAGRGRGIPVMSPVPGPTQPHISPGPTPGHIAPHMGMPYHGGPVPSIYHMPPPGTGRSIGHPQPPPPGQPIPGMYATGTQRPSMPQYPGAFMHTPQQPFSRPNW